MELTWILQPTVSALARTSRFAQTLNPWTGEQGFTEGYSPAILCLLDFVERLCGILPTPQGELWFTGLVPYEIEHRQEEHRTAYSRAVEGLTFELVNTPRESTLYLDGRVHLRFPHGVRAITDREGNLTAIIGMSAGTVEGSLHITGTDIPFGIRGNERLEWLDGTLVRSTEASIVSPSY